MPGALQLPGEIAHGGEDGDDLLGVVEDVVGLLANLHQDVNHLVIDGGEPAVLRI